MAKCGITLRYPVKLVPIHDDGTRGKGLVIGNAETLRQAVTLAERKGFHIRDDSDGGKSRLVFSHTDGKHCFIVTVYPD